MAFPAYAYPGLPARQASADTPGRGQWDLTLVFSHEHFFNSPSRRWARGIDQISFLNGPAPSGRSGLATTSAQRAPKEDLWNPETHSNPLPSARQFLPSVYAKATPDAVAKTLRNLS